MSPSGDPRADWGGSQALASGLPFEESTCEVHPEGLGDQLSVGR